MVELTIARALRLAVERNRPRPALVCGRRRLSFGELGELGNRVANALLAAGLKPGDRLGVMLPNSVEYVAVVYAAAQAGLVMMPLNYRLGGAEIAYPLSDGGARALIYAGQYRAEVDRARGSVPGLLTFAVGRASAADAGELLALAALQPSTAPAFEVRERDLFYLGYTSGTTGPPKGAMITQRNRALAVQLWALEYGVGSNDTALHVAPFHHTAPLTFTLTQLCMGGRVVILPRFDAVAVLRMLAAEGVTWAFMVPYMLNGLIAAVESQRRRVALRRLRFLISGGAALPTPTKLALLKVFPRLGLHEFYGATEAGIIANLEPRDQRRKVRCVGRPLRDVEVRIVLPGGTPAPPGVAGDIWVRSSTLFAGYYQAPAPTRRALRAGWATVGDIGRIDEQGYLYIVDRRKDVIKSGGVSVFPAEIEEVMLSHPGVLQAAVIGVPDARWGEAAHAVVVARPGHQPSGEELLTHCRRSLAGYKLPKSVEFRPSLPMSPAGKVLKRRLRARRLPAQAGALPPSDDEVAAD